ncbi:ABC transporter [Exidia glandulosa HHB12029]|uniref:ABC transporter n=1 Tax=Exidia glandulosa HHB12029 TaxID=1314781 RepID=A0A165QTW3_EXIGL|nr:ABC transporter [Exidia glandulosa HHB12029]
MSTAQSATASIDAHTLTEAQPGQTTDVSEQPKLEKSESKKSSTPDEYADTEKQDVEEDDESRFVTGKKLVLIFVGFLSSVFLIALDQTIVSTALPRIVSQFNALSQVTWVVSAYFLTQAGFMLTAGQLLTVTSTKKIYLVSITIFEIGSLICGVAKSMEVLIFGRAFAGVGAACIFVSVLSIISEITRLKDRPVLMGTFGGIFALASVLGPLLGGAFTDHVSWRWCFYINLPFGALAIGAVVFFLEDRRPRVKPNHVGLTTLQLWKKIDVIGSILCLGMVCALLLPLQWGGQEKEWNDKVVIALFCVFGVLLAMFIGWEYYMGEDAILPLFLLKNSTQCGAALDAFFMFLGLLLATYYLPLKYQAQGHSATKSGIDILPFQLACVFTAMGSGGIINFTGRYWPFLVGSPLLVSLASGLLYTINETTPNARVIGYQIILGVGVGGALQNVVIAIQAEYAHAEHMVPQTTAVVTWAQLLGGIIGIAIAGTVFANGLKANLPSTLPPEVALAVRRSVSVIFTLPEDVRAEVVHAYIKSIDQVFLVGVPAGVLASLSAFLVKNHNLKHRSAMQSGAGMI